MVKEVDSRRAPRERARGKSKGQEQEAGWQLVVFLVVGGQMRADLSVGQDWVLGRGLGVGEVHGTACEVCL